MLFANISSSKINRKEVRENLHKLLFATRKIYGFALRTSKWHTLIVFATTTILAIFPFFTAWITSAILDELVNLSTSANVSTVIFYKLVGAYIGVRIAARLLNALLEYSDQNMWFTVFREFSQVVTEKFSELDIQHYEDPETRNLIQKVSENYGHTPQNFVGNTTGLIRPVVQVISSITILFTFSPFVVALLFFTTIPEALINIIFGKRKWGVWDMKGEERRDYHWTRHHLQNEGSLVELRIFRIRHHFLDKVYNLFASFQNEQIKIENKRLVVGFLINLLSLFGYIYSYAKLGLSVIARTISIGQFSFYLSSADRLQGSFENIFSRVGRIYEYGLYVYDIFMFLELENKVISGSKELSIAKEAPVIEFRNVGFKYPGTEKYIIKNLNLVLKKGERIAIVGVNGAGKTTLIKLLMRFYDVTEGEILIDGINLKDLNIESWYTKVGALFQDFNTYHFDAKTNIQLGDISRLGDLDATIAAAKKAGAHEFIEKYDNGYDQVLSKSFKDGIRPSDGQWQRIALARVFFKNAPVLILDEPTSAIDPKAEYEIFERLFEFTHGKTVVIISHRFSTVKSAERIIVLDDGKIVEDGSHAQLMELEEGKYKTAFNLQKKGYE